MTGDGGEYLRPEDLKELGDDSLPSSQFLDGLNYLRYSLEGGRSDRYQHTCQRGARAVLFYNKKAGSMLTLRRKSPSWH